jgi:hypothetical protein
VSRPSMLPAAPASTSRRLQAGRGARIRSASTQSRAVRSLRRLRHLISPPSGALALQTLRTRGQPALAGSMPCSADSFDSGNQREPKRKPSTKTKTQNDNGSRSRWSSCWRARAPAPTPCSSHLLLLGYFYLLKKPERYFWTFARRARSAS